MKKNLSLKILVLIASVILWMLQMVLKVHTQNLSVPIQLTDIPENLVIMNEIEPSVSLTLEARGMDILFLKASNPYLEIDSKDFRYGKNTIILDKQNLIYPKRIKIDVKALNYDTSDWIMLDRYVSKRKPVKIQYSSAKDEEFYLKNKILTEQRKINIKGPLSLVNEIKEVQTQKITKRMLRDGKIKVILEKPDEKIELENTEIVFDVLEKKIITKTISLIPVKFPVNENITIIPQKVSIMVRGPEDILNKLDNRKIIASIEFDKTKNNDFVNIKFNLPSGVKLIDHTPQKIQVIKND